MWRFTTATLLAALSIGGPISPVAAVPAHSFSGQCNFAGTVEFSPPLKVLPGPGSSTARGAGTCTGSLQTGKHSREVVAAPTTYAATGFSTATSCAGALASGSGSFKIDGVPVEFSFDETRVGGVALLTLRGGTDMHGVVNVEPAGALDAVTACGGAGLTKVNVTGQYTSRSG